MINVKQLEGEPGNHVKVMGKISFGDHYKVLLPKKNNNVRLLRPKDLRESPAGYLCSEGREYCSQFFSS